MKCASKKGHSYTSNCTIGCCLIQRHELPIFGFLKSSEYIIHITFCALCYICALTLTLLKIRIILWAPYTAFSKVLISIESTEGIILLIS